MVNVKKLSAGYISAAVRTAVPAVAFFVLLASWALPVKAAENTPAYETLTSWAKNFRTNQTPCSDIPGASPAPASGWQLIEDNTGGGQNASLDSTEELHFWDKLQHDVFDDLCRQLKLRLKQDVEIPNIADVEGKAQRKLKRYPDNTLALIDELNFRLRLGHTRHLLDLGDDIGLGFHLGMRIEGASIVIRPMGGTKSCEAAARLLNIFKFKSIIPLKAKRISKMANGELWKIPAVIWAGFTPTIGGGAGNISVSVSFGISNERLSTVSLYRMNDRELRLRLRIDQAVIKASGVSLHATIAPVTVTLDNLDIALQDYMGELVGHTLARLAAKEFRDYVYASFGLTHANRRGRKLLMEYILDPRDEEQMEALVGLLRDGELDVLSRLVEMASRWNLIPDTDDINDISELHDLEEAWGGRLNARTSYAGVNGYDRTADGSRLHVPLIVNHRTSDGFDYERIYSSETDGGVLHIHTAYNRKSSDFIDLPFFGKIFKHNTNKTAYVFNRQAPDGSVSRPVLVYNHREGMVRYGKDRARKMLEEVNGIMRYAGVKGEGENPMAALPIDAIQPPGRKSFLNLFPKIYKSAVMNFTLTFNENAILDIMLTRPAMIFKAFANLLKKSSKALMHKLLSVAKIGDDGSVNFKRGDIARSLWNRARDLCRTASRLVRDIIAIRSAGSWKKRSELLAKLISGKSESRFGYSRILKVLIQLVSPRDITAVMTYNTNKKVKTEEDVSVRYEFKPGGGTQTSIAESFHRERIRFATPSTLSD